MKKKRNRIGVIATSHYFKSNEDASDLYKPLVKMGFEIIEAPSLRKQIRHNAGSIEDRVEDIHAFYKDNSIDIIMSFWGGLNTNELLPHLDFKLIKKYKKPIIGYSDTTALLLAIDKYVGSSAYMGPSGITFNKQYDFEFTIDSFIKTVCSKWKSITVTDADYVIDEVCCDVPKNVNDKIKKI